MMPIVRLLFVFALFIFPSSALAQESEDAVKEKLRQQTAFLEQVLGDAKNLRLPENRAFVFVKIGNGLWEIEEKRARQLFQSSINELIAAQTAAETEKGNKQAFNNLVYGQSPRWEILYAIANRDADLALDAMVKTRPSKIAEALANLADDDQSQNQQYARNEIQSEQRLIALAAEQNPERAIKLLRESLKKSVSYETFQLLRKIHQKDAETADQLAEEVGQKLLAIQLSGDNQDSSLIQYFLAEFGQTRTPEDKSIVIPDSLIRSLAEKIIKFTLRPDSNSFYGNSGALQIIERLFPAAAAQIKQKQAKFQNQSEQHKDYYKLLQSDVSAEQLISEAEKFPRSLRTEIYRKAAEKTAQSGNVSQAQTILTTRLSADEAGRYLSQFNYNLAVQAVSQGKFDEAAAIINQITDENNQLSALIYLATTLHQKNPKENQSRAAAVLEQARVLVSDAPEKLSAMNSLLSIASAYAAVEPAQAFRLIESLIAPLNEFSEASAVVAKFSDYGNFRQGEYQLSDGNNSLGVYNLTGVLEALKNSDFERAVKFTNSFSRLDIRLTLQLQLLDFNLPAANPRSNSMKISVSRRGSR